MECEVRYLNKYYKGIRTLEKLISEHARVFQSRNFRATRKQQAKHKMNAFIFANAGLLFMIGIQLAAGMDEYGKHTFHTRYVDVPKLNLVAETCEYLS